MKKKIATLLTLMTMGITALAPMDAMAAASFDEVAIEVQEGSISGISSEDASITRKANYTWVYKVVDGVMYKRLYDLTTGKFVGDWIRMG